MAIIAKTLTKRSVISVSMGTVLVLIVAIWTGLGIGRPLFASDLNAIEKKIDTYQVNTAVQILLIRRAALQSDERAAKRDLRHNADDDSAADDLEEIEDNLEAIDAKIQCYRIAGCQVESET